MTGSRTRLSNAAHQAMLQRGELSRSFSRTKKAVTPTGLKDRASYHVKSGAQDMVDFGREEITQNRFWIIAGGIGLTAYLFREPIKEKAPQLAKAGKRKGLAMLAAVSHALDPEPEPAIYDLVDKNRKRDKLRNSVSNIWPEASKIGAKFMHQVEDMMKPFGETARDTREKASELAERGAESARRTAEAAKERVQHGYGRARELGSELASKGRDQAHVAKDAAEQALLVSKEKAHVAGSRLAKFAKEQPLTLLAGAVAVGILAGALLSRKDEENKD